MTRDEILALSGAALSEAVAEAREPKPVDEAVHSEEWRWEPLYGWRVRKDYANSIAAAWELVETGRESGWFVSVRANLSRKTTTAEWIWLIEGAVGGHRSEFAEADNRSELAEAGDAPAAISRAWLLARGEETT